MKLQRLSKMSIPELLCRGRQEISKRMDQTGLAVRADGQALRALSRDRFRDVGPSRFFQGAGDRRTVARITERLPEARDRAIAAAEAVRRKHFDLLGYRDLFFGDPVDWHLDPISGRRAPLVHWSRLDPLDAASVGDSKVVWELNRHQYFVQLGQAYQLTGDERYAEAFAQSVQAWMQANPPGLGINWASSLEVALRLIAWCWALILFRESETLSQELFARVLDGIQLQALHVERYLSRYFSPNTHLTGEALGLFYAGIVFPELRRADRWRAKARRILVEQCERQLLPDGVYFERATCYQRYTIEIYLHFLILAKRHDLVIPAMVGDRLQGLLDFLLAVSGPDGSMPQIGDADGGWLLPLTTRLPDDLRGLFSTAAAFFHRPDYAWVAGSLAPETLWLLGGEGLEALEALRPTAPTKAPSCLFPDGGYAVMRGGWEESAHRLIFDVGPLGCPVSGGHGHADLLSVQCAPFGTPYLVDAGTFCYTSDREWRDFFRSAAAHSTVLVDGETQAVSTGPFTWKLRPDARLRRWLTTHAFDLADGHHAAYGGLSDPVLHRRRVLFVKPRYWVLADDLDGSGRHRVELRFQFAPMEVTVGSGLWARACGAEGHALLIRPFAGVPLKADVIEGGLDPIQGWVSPDYGRRQPAPVLIYSTESRLPVRILTLLFPTKDPLAPPPPVSPLGEGGPGPAGLLFDDGDEVVRFEDLDNVAVHSSTLGGIGEA